MRYNIRSIWPSSAPSTGADSISGAWHDPIWQPRRRSVPLSQLSDRRRVQALDEWTTAPPHDSEWGGGGGLDAALSRCRGGLTEPPPGIYIPPTGRPTGAEGGRAAASCAQLDRHALFKVLTAAVLWVSGYAASAPGFCQHSFAPVGRSYLCHLKKEEEKRGRGLYRSERSTERRTPRYPLRTCACAVGNRQIGALRIWLPVTTARPEDTAGGSKVALPGAGGGASTRSCPSEVHRAS